MTTPPCKRQQHAKWLCCQPKHTSQSLWQAQLVTDGNCFPWVLPASPAPGPLQRLRNAALPGPSSAAQCDCGCHGWPLPTSNGGCSNAAVLAAATSGQVNIHQTLTWRSPQLPGVLLDAEARPAALLAPASHRQCPTAAVMCVCWLCCEALLLARCAAPTTALVITDNHARALSRVSHQHSTHRLCLRGLQVHLHHPSPPPGLLYPCLGLDCPGRMEGSNGSNCVAECLYTDWANIWEHKLQTWSLCSGFSTRQARLSAT
jgi:hypothetical protein